MTVDLVGRPMTAPLPPGRVRRANIPLYIDRSADDDTAMRARFAPFGDDANLEPAGVGQDNERCATCQGRIWSVRLGEWVGTRETVGMVCQTCGTDYGPPAAVADNAGDDDPCCTIDGGVRCPDCPFSRPAASPGVQADEVPPAQVALIRAAHKDRGCPSEPCPACAPALADDGRTEAVARALEAACTDDATWESLATAALLAAATTGGGDDGAVQRVLELADEMEEDSKLAKRFADEARTLGDRELQRINIRHARVASHAASAIRGAVAGGQDAET